MVLLLFYAWFYCLTIGTLVGLRKGRFVPGFILPFLLGPLGLLVVSFLPNKKRE